MLHKFIFNWFPAIGWMLTIFLLSTRQSISINDTYIINFAVFKTLHLIEYGVLYFLVLRLVYRSTDDALDFKKYLFAALVTLFYAALDELHQTYVPTRTGKPRDILIDAVGISLSFLIIRRYLDRFRAWSLL